MNCRIIYKDNKIDHVQAENGERSILFDSLKDIFGAEKALELYALTEEDGYKQKIQEKVRSFVGVTEKQIDKLSEVIDAQETLDKLVETGLADNVYQMTSEELEAKLVELGVEADVAKQVAQSGGYYSNATAAFSNLKDKNVKNVQGWMKALTDVQKNGGIKNVNQELEWIGLEDYLNNYVKENNPKAGNIPSSVVEDYIKSNQIEIVDVSKGTASDDMSKSEVRDEFYNEAREALAIQEELNEESEDILDTWYNNPTDSNFNEVKLLLEDIGVDLSYIYDKNSNEINNATKYSGYQLKGGENYREVLLTMPPSIDKEYEKELIKRYGEGNYYNMASYEERDRLYRGVYKSSHWDEKNILAHVRLNEKTLPDGRKVLIINEIQSDWAQEGRKKGFTKKQPFSQEEFNNIVDKRNEIFSKNVYSKITVREFDDRNEYKKQRSLLKEEFEKSEDYLEYSRLDKLVEEFIASTDVNKITQTPYSNTDQWVGLVTRKVMQMASQEGYDGIAFATGQQSADMYSLSQQVDKIDINPQGDIKAVYISMKNNADDTVFINQEGVITESASGVYNGKQAEEVLGKDLTKKILETTEETTLEGEGLEFGGEGMKTFYDKIVPKVVQKEAQRFDKNAKLETVDFGEKISVDITEEDGGFILKVDNKFVEYVDEETLLNANLENTKEGAKKYFEKYIPQEINADKLSLGAQPYLPLTQSIKDSVSKGIPQFQKSGITPITNGFIYKNDVYLNKNADESTMVHEFNHLYNNWLKQNRPEVYKKGLGLVKAEVEKTANVSFSKQVIDSENKDFIQDFSIASIKGKEYQFLKAGNVFYVEVDGVGEVARATLNKDGYLDNIRVDENYRRKGIGSALYDYIENISGNTLKPSPIKISKEAQSLWEKRGRKSEIQDIIDFVKTNQPNLEGDALLEEILTEMVGRKGLELLNEQKDKAKSSGIIDYLKQVWQEIKNMLGLSSYTDEQILNMNLQDFANASAVDLLSGEKLKKDEAIKRNNGNPLNLAPNGKPSILYQSYKDLGYSDVEAERLVAQVYSDEFISWSNNWNNLLLDDNGQPKLFYHSSKSQGITNFNITVSNDDFSKGGFFVTPKQGWDFNKTGIEYSLFVGENEDSIFDIENKKHINNYVDYIYNEYKNDLGKITKEDLNKVLIFDGKNTLYNVFEDKYTKELKKYSESYRDEPLFDEEGDFYRTKTSKEFAIEDLQNYFDKKNELSLVLNTLNSISRIHSINKDYLSLERNGDIFEKIGFNGAYVFESKIKNIHLYKTDRIKSATENIGTFSEESNDIRYQVIGEKGASKIKETLDLLNQAKELEDAGEDEKVIEQKTGWFKQNGDWKYFSKETLNSMFPTKTFINKVKIGQEYKLEEVLGNNKLFEYYPQLKDIKLKIYNGTKEQSVGLRNSEASYNGGLLLLNVFDNRGNGINPFDNTGQGKSKQSIINDRENFWANKILPLVHEIQHIIQETENFPMGGNPFTIEKVARKLSNSPEGIPFSEFLQNVENTLKENKNLSKEDLGVLNAQKKSLEFFIKSGSRSDLSQQYKMLFGEFEARTVEYIKQKYAGNNEKLYTEIQDELSLIESIKQEELIPVRKTSSNLKIEVKEVNGRLVVEPLVNGTKAGALRMLPYEDGYRVDSVTVYDKYQNRRLGTRLYQEAIKFLLKSQTPLYSLKVRTENAKKIWDKFVEIGVAQKVGEDYIAPNKGGLDKNNEATPSDVMQYANTTDEKLSKEETAEAIDLAVSLGVESSQEAVAILKDAFLENDSFVFDKKKMKKAGFNDYEITKILVDVNLQNQIKNNLAKLENTEFVAPLMDVQTIPEIGIFGKQKVKPKVKTVNVKTVNEQGEVVDKVSDTKELLRKTYPDTLPNDVPQIASSLLKASENVVNTHNDLFYSTLKDLKDAALDLGVDLKDIENRVFPLENFKSFVNSFMEYYANPSDAFAEVYDKFFENYGVEKTTKPTMSTPYTEYELFDKFNLVRNGDEYVKVEDVEIEPSAERQAKIPQLEVEDFAVDFDKLEKLVYHKEQLGAEMKTLQKPLVEEINLREVKKNPYLKATSEGVKLVSEDPLTAQKAELYGYEPKPTEKQPKKIETDYSLVQDVLVTQLTSENKVRTPKGNFTKFMDDNNKSVFLLDGSKQSTVDLEGYLSKADNTPKIEAKKLYSKEEFENNFGCLN